MLVHRLAESDPGVYADSADALPTAEEVDAFSSLLLADDVEALDDFVELLRRRGFPRLPRSDNHLHERHPTGATRLQFAHQCPLESHAAPWSLQWALSSLLND
jgi:hypothetical protein